MSDDQQFQAVDAGSADCTPTPAGSIKKGGYCMLKGFPCRVTDFSTAKPGKHGSAKATIVGVDIFTNKKHEDSMPTGATAQVPIVTKVEYEVADVNEEDNFVALIQEDGSLKEDLKLPVGDEVVYNELKKVWDENNEKGQVFFSVIKACGQQKFISARVKDS